MRRKKLPYIVRLIRYALTSALWLMFPNDPSNKENKSAFELKRKEK